MAPRKIDAKPAANAATDTPERVKVRLVINVDVDAAAWRDAEMAAAHSAPGLDTDKIINGLVSAGLPAEQAVACAAKLVASQGADGVLALKSRVKDHLLAALRADERLKSADGTVTAYKYERAAAA